MVVADTYDVVYAIQVCVVQGTVPVLLATFEFHQSALELRQVTTSDQHFATSGIELAKLRGAVGRCVVVS